MNWKGGKTINFRSPLPLMYFLQQDCTLCASSHSTVNRDQAFKCLSLWETFCIQTTTKTKYRNFLSGFTNHFSLSGTLTNYYNLMYPSPWVLMFSHQKFCGKSRIWVRGPVLKMQTLRWCFLRVASFRSTLPWVTFYDILKTFLGLKLFLSLSLTFLSINRYWNPLLTFPK